MISSSVRDLALVVATFPFIYYLLSIFSSWRFFHQGSKQKPSDAAFTPPVSNLKPIRGLDPDAYENFASLCRQDYPEYELLFCVGSLEDPVVPVIRQLAHDYPNQNIRLIVEPRSAAANDKVAKLARLSREASHEYLVINDSDVRVNPDYFRTVVAPLRNPDIGGVTCLYVATATQTFAENLQWLGMISDFFPSILTAWQLEGVKFALGTTIATTRTRLEEAGGYAALINRPADDLLVGRMIAESGAAIELLPYAVSTVADFHSLEDLLKKRLRWIVVMRHIRPIGHLGLLFTHGLAWSAIAFAICPTASVASLFFGVYFLLRLAMTWTVGQWGLKQKSVWLKAPLFVIWDVIALALWLLSFTRDTIHWRDGRYRIRGGRLIPVIAEE
jgi:ceramide glucosyltransferase